jgi:hypothetical protein
MAARIDDDFMTAEHGARRRNRAVQLARGG